GAGCDGIVGGLLSWGVENRATDQRHHASTRLCSDTASPSESHETGSAGSEIFLAKGRRLASYRQSGVRCNYFRRGFRTALHRNTDPRIRGKWLTGWQEWLRPVYMAIFCGGIRSQTRQNSSISGGVPRETRRYLFISGMGRATTMLCFLRCSRTSPTGRRGFNI